MPPRSSVPALLIEQAHGQKPLRHPGAGQTPFSDLHRGGVAARVHPAGVGADHPDKCLSSFKSYTAGRLIELLQACRAERLLDRLRLTKQAHKRDREYQFWQEGSHAELICSEPVMRQKLDYIHQNPVQRGYMDLPEHWRYSSARNYLGQAGLIEIDPWF